MKDRLQTNNVRDLHNEAWGFLPGENEQISARLSSLFATIKLAFWKKCSKTLKNILLKFIF